MSAVIEAPNLGAEPPVILPADAARTSHRYVGTVYPVLIAISFCHLFNDTIQSLIPALYLPLSQKFGLGLGQVGFITLAFQLTASLLQPLIGLYTDRRSLPFSLAVGMTCTLTGLLMLSVAWSYPMLLVSVAVVGLGSAVFHPESSRVARMASGGRFGFAQSVFQVGGNAGAALGPVCAAFVVLRFGQYSVSWFGAAALAAIGILAAVGTWYKRERVMPPRTLVRARPTPAFPRRTVVRTLTILAALMFSKFVYTASMSSYFTFYLKNRFHLTDEAALLHLCLYLSAIAVGTLAGGLAGDRWGRKYVIWFSILGVFPFTVALPYADLFWTGVLSVLIGLILSSAFSAIVVYAQELVPGNVGMVSGLFFGLAFGMGGIGAAGLGQIADHAGVQFVFKLCSFLPLIGLLTVLLPDIETPRPRKSVYSAAAR